MTPEVTTGNVSTTTWTQRIVLELPKRQHEKLKKGKRALVMRNKQLYEIKVGEIPVVFNSNGKQLTKAQLKALLRRM
jgi:hypothetical protein